MVTPDQIAEGGTDWMLLDPEDFPDYNHPAYYNTSFHRVVDSTPGDEEQGWTLVDASSVESSSSSNSSQSNTDEDSSNIDESTDMDTANESDSEGTTESTEIDNSKVLYNSSTQEVITLEQIQAGGTDWMLLDSTQYPDYNHPAYYNISFHRVVDNTPGDIEQGWELVDASSIETDGTDPATEKSLYNTVTHETISPEQIAAGGTGWILLDAGFVGNDGTSYEHPAYYNTTTHGVLDNSEGDIEDGWVLID